MIPKIPKNSTSKVAESRRRAMTEEENTHFTKNRNNSPGEKEDGWSFFIRLLAFVIFVAFPFFEIPDEMEIMRDWQKPMTPMTDWKNFIEKDLFLNPIFYLSRFDTFVRCIFSNSKPLICTFVNDISMLPRIAKVVPTSAWFVSYFENLTPEGLNLIHALIGLFFYALCMVFIDKFNRKIVPLNGSNVIGFRHVTLILVYVFAYCHYLDDDEIYETRLFNILCPSVPGCVDYCESTEAVVTEAVGTVALKAEKIFESLVNFFSSDSKTNIVQPISSFVMNKRARYFIITKLTNDNTIPWELVRMGIPLVISFAFDPLIIFALFLEALELIGWFVVLFVLTLYISINIFF